MSVYVDDLIVKSKAEESHAKVLEEVFTVLDNYGIKLNPENVSLE